MAMTFDATLKDMGRDSPRGFLDAIRNEITNDRMNELLQTGVVAKLEAISDKELDASLRNIAAYNPVTFRERMKELGGLLPEE